MPRKMTRNTCSMMTNIPNHWRSDQPSPAVCLMSRAIRAQFEMMLVMAVIRKARYQPPMSRTAMGLGFLDK